MLRVKALNTVLTGVLCCVILDLDGRISLSRGKRVLRERWGFLARSYTRRSAVHGIWRSEASSARPVPCIHPNNGIIIANAASNDFNITSICSNQGGVIPEELKCYKTVFECTLVRLSLCPWHTSQGRRNAIFSEKHRPRMIFRGHCRCHQLLNLKDIST